MSNLKKCVYTDRDVAWGNRVKNMSMGQVVGSGQDEKEKKKYMAVDRADGLGVLWGVGG